MHTITLTGFQPDTPQSIFDMENGMFPKEVKLSSYNFIEDKYYVIFQEKEYALEWFVFDGELPIKNK